MVSILKSLELASENNEMTLEGTNQFYSQTIMRIRGI